MASLPSTTASPEMLLVMETGPALIGGMTAEVAAEPTDSAVPCKSV